MGSLNIMMDLRLRTYLNTKFIQYLYNKQYYTIFIHGYELVDQEAII